MAAREYVTREPAPAAATNPMALLGAELEAQHKQFDLIMKQNADLLTAMAKNGGSDGGGSGGSGGRGSGRQKHSPTALCPNCNKMATHKREDCYSLEEDSSLVQTSQDWVTGTGVHHE